MFAPRLISNEITKTVSRSVFAGTIMAVGFLVGCSSDDAATKDDAAVTAEEAPAEEAPAEEAPMEAPAEEAAEAGPDLTVFEKAAVVTQAETSAGVAAVRVRDVTAEGGYAACGLQDDDVIASISGADVPAGRPGVDALIDACAHKKPIVVERGGETLTLGAQ